MAYHDITTEFLDRFGLTLSVMKAGLVPPGPVRLGKYDLDPADAEILRTELVEYGAAFHRLCQEQGQKDNSATFDISSARCSCGGTDADHYTVTLIFWPNGRPKRKIPRETL